MDANIEKQADDHGFRQITDLPEGLLPTQADFEKSERPLEENVTRECIEILFSYNWLTNHYKGLVALWHECETPLERNLIRKLLQRFNYIDHATYVKDCEAIAEVICKQWNALAHKTWIIAAAENTESDGSHNFLNQLRDSFQPPWIDSNFVSRMTNIHTKIADGDLVILVDDFTGSGTTASRKLKQMIQSIQKKQKGISFNVKFVSFAGMELGKKKIQDMGIECHVHRCYKKGISDLSAAEEVKSEILTMLALENRLGDSWLGKEPKEYSFGFGEAEALFYQQGRRVPNNVFPIFWWPTSRTKGPRVPFFKRSRPD